MGSEMCIRDSIKATREGAAGRIPVTVKTRLGWNQVDLSWHELLLQQNLDMLTIHGRTKKEMSAVPAHWDIIGQIREMRDKIAPDTLLVGNGDVENHEHGMKLAQEYNLDGIMIGRGIFKDPYAFAEISPWSEKTRHERISLFAQHVKLFNETWQNVTPGRVAALNKFCKIYVSDFDGAKELREKLMNAKSAQELMAFLDAALLENN